MEDVAKRIGELLDDGEYATNVELAETFGYERIKVAESFWYLYHDLSDEAKEQSFLPSLQEISVAADFRRKQLHWLKN